MSTIESELVAIRKLMVTQAIATAALVLALDRSSTAAAHVKDVMDSVRAIDRQADAARGK